MGRAWVCNSRSSWSVSYETTSMTLIRPDSNLATNRVVDNDSDLVRRARGGDLTAFGDLVERHRAIVYRVAARMVGADDADDVTQDAFLRAFHRLDRFRGDAPFRGWLLRIAHNAALDCLDRRRRDPDPLSAAGGGESGDGDVVSVGAVAAKSPAEALEASERRARLEAKLDSLRASHRSVLVLRDLEGFAYDEIAELTEMPLGSVKGRLSRALAELVELLRSNTYDWELPR
jgi:RNA polymerase sigma-70 factor (ECF subfamily)